MYCCDWEYVLGAELVSPLSAKRLCLQGSGRDSVDDGIVYALSCHVSEYIL